MKDYRTLHRGLRALFWVEIIGMIGTTVGSVATVAVAVAKEMETPYIGNHLLQLPMVLWSLALVLAYVVIHFCLGRAERRYTVTGVLLLLNGAFSVLLPFLLSFFVDTFPSPLHALRLLGFVALALYIAYFCMQIAAHRHALAGVDDKLAKRWRVLRILFLCSIPAMLMFVVPEMLMFVVLMVIALIAELAQNSAVMLAVVLLIFLILGGMIALYVLRYIYLYKTGTRFKRMIHQEETEESTDEERTDIHWTREND